MLFPFFEGSAAAPCFRGGRRCQGRRRKPDVQTLRPAVILWASRQNGAGMPVRAFPPAEGTRVAPDGYAPAGNAETAQIPAVSAPLPERTGGKSLSGRGKTRPARRQSVRRGDPAGNLPDAPPPAPDTAHSGAEQAGNPFLYVMLWRGVRPRVTARHRRGDSAGSGSRAVLPNPFTTRIRLLPPVSAAAVPAPAEPGKPSPAIRSGGTVPPRRALSEHKHPVYYTPAAPFCQQAVSRARRGGKKFVQSGSAAPGFRP